MAKHRAEFNRLKNSLIDEWELKTGQTWPTYLEDVIGKNGNVVRKAGSEYDAHHIILLKILMVAIMNGGIFTLLDFQMNIKLVYIELDHQLENYLIKEGILNV
ncbi:hypothetical protein [uncultured Streptococcus sp.]|uniref:hypothetical protein n=1 Tax=uncultured Streptococcus sp. TaxID=83427 RepID=UPI0028EA03AC|nr:hypothetical protein [uncultured Streptococcus sp.]